MRGPRSMTVGGLSSTPLPRHQALGSSFFSLAARYHPQAALPNPHPEHLKIVWSL